MSLLNVRLDAGDARKTAALRKNGVQISALVRQAIRAEFERRIERAAGRQRPSETVARILASLPDPPGTPPRSFDIRDRRAVRRHIASRLARRRK